MQKTIDTHFHVWCLKDLPWLSGLMVPRIFGPYEAIRRDYLIEEYFAEFSEEDGIEKAVYVQTNWPKERYEDEVAWVQKTADESGWPHAIVGYADMTVDDVRPQLDRLMRYPLIRGVRMQLHWHETPEYRFAPSADQVLDPMVLRNISRLKDYGLSFDLQLFPSQMCHGAQLVRENPEIDFILTHSGMLTDLSVATVEAWQAGLHEFRGMPNFYAKLSGLGTFVHRNDADLISYIVDQTIEIFGSEHLMFGSNFPVEKLWTDYSTLFEAYQQAVGRHNQADHENIFYNTAARVYRPS